MDGNVESLAKQVEKGANSIEGVEAKLWQAYITLLSVQFSLLKCFFYGRIFFYQIKGKRNRF